MGLGINNGNNIQYPYNKQNQQQNDNFGALSPQAQQNLQKMETSVKNTAEGSWFGNILRGFGIKDPKKAVISVIGAVGVVFGLSGLVNTAVKKGALVKLGQGVDALIDNNKTLKNLSKKITKKTSSISKSFKRWIGKTDLGELKGNMLKSTKNKQMLLGPKGEALDGWCDTISTLSEKHNGLKNSIKGLLGKETNADVLDAIKKLRPDEDAFKQLSALTGKTDSQEIAKSIQDILENKKFSTLLEKLTGKGDKATVDAFLDTVKKCYKDEDLKSEEFAKLYKQITNNFTKDNKLDVYKMQEVFKELAKDPGYTSKLGGWLNKSNAIESLMKRSILEGDSAKYGVSKTLQKLILKTGEGITNGVTSRNTFGILMGLGIYYGVMNKTQEAPKKEKVSTFAEEAVSDAGLYMLGPLTASILYGGASLKYLGAKSADIKNYKSGLKDLTNLSQKGLSDAQAQRLLKKVDKGLSGRSKSKLLKAVKDQLPEQEADQILKKAEKGLSKIDISDIITKLGKKADRADIKNQFNVLKKTFNSSIKNDNIIKKGLRKIASALSVGLEKNPGKSLVSQKISGFSGGVLRGGLLMLAITPLLIKPIMKVCHKVFGKPTNTNYPDKQDKARQQQEEALKQQQEMMQQIQNMTPEQQYQVLSQLSQMPQITSNPQQKAQIDQALMALQSQMQQPAVQQPQTAPNQQIQQPQPISQPQLQPAAYPPTLQPQQTIQPQLQPAAYPPALQPQQTIQPQLQPALPLNTEEQKIQSIDAGRSYIPSDAPAPNLIRKDLQK